MEIERKFLVKEIPFDIISYDSHKTNQGYLPSENPGAERRVRKKGNKYFYTEKTKGNLSRDEKEEEITESKFLTFWKATEGKRIEKIRYNIPYFGKIIELDIYTGSLEGLLIAEIEFVSEEDAKKFTVPSWFGREVTYDERYRNRNLAVNGIPNQV